MLAQLLKKKTKKPKTKSSSSKGKGKEGEKSTSKRNLRLKGLKVRITPILNLSNLHLKRRMVQKMEAVTLSG